MIGIYKITSPSNKIYIGQAVNIQKRWTKYKALHCKSQRRLYNSFIKHTVDAHNFEILEECLFEDLNTRERYWQDYYDVLNDQGLNCMLQNTTTKVGVKSEESIQKHRLQLLGRKHTAESKKLVSINNAKFWKDKEFSKEHKEKLASAKNKSVIDTSTNIIYNSLKDAAKAINLTTGYLGPRLRGERVNDTTFRYIKL